MKAMVGHVSAAQEALIQAQILPKIIVEYMFRISPESHVIT